MPTRFGRDRAEEELIRRGEIPEAEGMQEAGLPDPVGLIYGRRADIREEDRDLHRIGEKEIEEAIATLTKYKQGKANLERQIVEDELWYRMRHWDVIRKNQEEKTIQPEPSSGWLFNAILNKHADAMDNIPEPIVLPRERSDEKSAKVLTSVLPVVMENCGFEDVYSKNWWQKLKHGVAAYGVFWNAKKSKGLGDIDIKRIDILKVFWEPGITDIQDSRNLFIVELVDTDLLEQQYPDRKGKLSGNTIDVTEYKYDDAVDTSGKSLVVDWYYKIVTPEGKTVLHYAKFVGKELLFASENDPQYSERGWYDHGLYPVVFDVLYPVEGTPVGFGLVAICKDPQMYIDKLSQNIMEASLMGSKKRFFVSDATNINVNDYLDWNNPIVKVDGSLDETRIREITVDQLPAIYYQVMQGKVEEMKDTSANRDINSGGPAGVTAASAIAALQEAGNKSSRDMISQSYRSYTEVVKLCLELIRQFYDETRSFRITGEQGGDYSFIGINNAILKEVPNGENAMGELLYREPIFDLKIKAQKKSPFSRMEQNERAKELYGLGFFNPEQAQAALCAIEMMDFEGIEKVREQISQGQTLLNIVQQQSQQMQQMAALLQAYSGTAGAGAPAGVPAGGGAAAQMTDVGAATDEAPGAQNKLASGVMQAQTPMTSYGSRLAKRSSPDMNVGSDAAAVGV